MNALRTLCILMLAAGTAFAASPAPPALPRAIDQARDDLATARAELEALRDTIAAERIPLAAQLQQQLSAIRQLRTTVTGQSGGARHHGRAMETLKADVRRLEGDCRFLDELLTEYRRSMVTRVSAAEADHLRRRLEATDTMPGETAGSFLDLPDRFARLAGIAIDAQQARIGGLRLDATVLSADGTEREARLVSSGPLAYAVERDGPLAGIAVSRPGSLAPELYTTLPVDAVAAIRDLVEGRPAAVPVDVTPQGDAMRAAEHTWSLQDELRGGGFVMFPLVAVGLAALLITLWKLIEMSRISVQDDRAVAAALDALVQQDEAAALQAAAGAGMPLAALLRDAITHRAASREHLEEILHEHIVAGIPRLERHLGTLAVLGGIAPLLGLLGTVTGMMHTFQLVTLFGTGEARLLSGGISEALITTKFGLSIAIPVLLAHAFLARHVRTQVSRLETSAVMFVNRLKQKAESDA